MRQYIFSSMFFSLSLFFLLSADAGKLPFIKIQEKHVSQNGNDILL